MLKIAVFVSGRGSNLKAIIDAIENKNLNAEIKLIISNKADCAAFKLADLKNIPTFCVSASRKENYLTFDEISELLKNTFIDLIVLAGFLKKIPDNFIDKFESKIINIHPALLPAFGGKGMFGMNVHKAVYDSTAKVSGVTIHFVDKIYDNGKIIVQKCVDISRVKSPEEIADKVLAEEHKLLPLTIKLFSENKIKVERDRVFIED